MLNNKLIFRQLHYKLAPIMLFPIFLTAITGSLFQVSMLTGKSSDFLWLLELHRGKFGVINLEIIYPFLNAFGVLFLTFTGIVMWFKTNRKIKK
ncbi:hypothetical protein [[Limnothrix rosea] IAM M-220]|uniref:hypothetical protein n=1 Tax=[Limnothrix rosea] IAM M-220 TaxID=454133 RepID=UPI00096731F2|nr:hypothetical protein [[Limnothrix rosea] IAM M-220]OKH17683.1 hypothetical protein NIES208_08495 [[Limnothrix rosea] IAM M-220]